MALPDVDRAAEPGAELHGRGAGGLVLGDADSDRKHPRPHRARRLVDPGPGADHVVAARRAPEALDRFGRSELLELELWWPFGTASHEGQPPLVAHRHLADRPGGRPPPPGPRRSASSHAVPTVGWPANPMSTAGVKMRISPRSGSSTNTVSLSPRSAATPWRRSGGMSEPSRKTPSGVPPVPSSTQKTRSRWSPGMAPTLPC